MTFILTSSAVDEVPRDLQDLRDGLTSEELCDLAPKAQPPIRWRAICRAVNHQIKWEAP